MRYTASYRNFINNARIVQFSAFIFKSNFVVVVTTLKQLTCNAVLVTLNSVSWGWARASLSYHEQLLNLIPGTREDVGKVIEAVFRATTLSLVPNFTIFQPYALRGGSASLMKLAH